MAKNFDVAPEFPQNSKSKKSSADNPIKADEPSFPEQLFNQRQVRQMCGGVSDMTIWRLRKNKILLEPIVLNGRNYWKRSELVAFFTKLGAGK